MGIKVVCSSSVLIKMTRWEEERPDFDGRGLERTGKSSQCPTKGESSDIYVSFKCSTVDVLFLLPSSLILILRMFCWGTIAWHTMMRALKLKSYDQRWIVLYNSIKSRFCHASSLILTSKVARDSALPPTPQNPFISTLKQKKKPYHMNSLRSAPVKI